MAEAAGSYHFSDLFGPCMLRGPPRGLGSSSVRSRMMRATGDVNLKAFPLVSKTSSVMGLDWRDPEYAKAVTSLGDATKEWVPGLPSCLPTKLQLKEEITEFATPLGGQSVCSAYVVWPLNYTFLTSVLFHCPTQGPQELLKRTGPASWNAPRIPSLSAVARTCSLPAVTKN